VLPFFPMSVLAPLSVCTVETDALPGKPALSPVGVKTVSQKFRIAAKRLFLTYPQCAVSKEVALQRILSVWTERLEWAIVAEESHKDGTPHLHCILSFHTKSNFKSADFADFVGEKHGNYQSVKSLKKCMAYVKKCQHFVVHGVPPEDSTLKKPVAHLVEMIQAGSRLSEIWNEEPVAFFLHGRKVKEMLAQVQEWTALSQRLPWLLPTAASIYDSPQIASVQLWLEQNVRVPRVFKQPHLWIQGNPGIGKSTFLRDLQLRLQTFEPEQSNHYWDGWSDDVELVVFDEYRGGKTIRDLNAFLDGSQCRLTCRGYSVLKKHNPPTIFCSNYTISDCYSKADFISVAALKLRITEVCLGDQLLRFAYCPPTPVVGDVSPIEE